MERVGQTLNRAGHHGSGNATDLTKQILADPRVASFIQEHSLSQDEIKRSLLSLINSWWNAVRSKKVMPRILPRGMNRF